MLTHEILKDRIDKAWEGFHLTIEGMTRNNNWLYVNYREIVTGWLFRNVPVHSPSGTVLWPQRGELGPGGDSRSIMGTGVWAPKLAKKSAWRWRSECLLALRAAPLPPKQMWQLDPLESVAVDWLMKTKNLQPFWKARFRLQWRVSPKERITLVLDDVTVEKTKPKKDFCIDHMAGNKDPFFPGETFYKCITPALESGKQKRLVDCGPGYSYWARDAHLAVATYLRYHSRVYSYRSIPQQEERVQKEWIRLEENIKKETAKGG